MTTAAGVLFLTPEGKALFLKRGPKGDFPGSWCFPGGGLEDGETTAQTAAREALEETGFEVDPKKLTPWTRARGPVGVPDEVIPPAAEPVDFTTFVLRVKEEFAPTLNEEHDGYSWSPLGDPPQPTHPGVQVAVDRVSMDELGVARAIADGRLVSPQVYENVTLFAIRITGTGAAYREGLDEYVWRDPEHYLNDEFLARCNGLAVIFEHPKKALLDSKEFKDRIVGTVLLPFIRGDEVWGIAKIYDAAAARIMSERQLSTSPGVTWRDLSVNVVLKRDDGSRLLVEGKPSLLDHVAVCALGVWDKGGDPQGVQNDAMSEPTVERTDSTMTEEEKRAAAEAQAALGTKMDKILGMLEGADKRFDAIEARLDAAEEAKSEEEEKKAKADAEGCEKMDKARKDGEDEESEDEKKADKTRKDKARKDEDEESEEAKEARMKADKVRKDAEDEEKEKEEKERNDAARVDAAKTVDEVRTLVDKLAKRIPKQLSDADFRELRSAQARADAVYNMFGKQAPRPMHQESLQEYRLRIVDELKEHSPAWGKSNLEVVAVDSAAFDVAEGAIYDDARRAAMNPVDLGIGELRPVTRVDSTTQRVVTEFYGRQSFVKQFSRPPQYVTRINVKNGQEASDRAA